MEYRKLGRSELLVPPLVVGGNVLGWTADEPTSFAILDAFHAAGFNAIDTADSYSRWVPGNDSESERIIGRWMRARANRAEVLVFTKVGSPLGEGTGGLGRTWITCAVEDSLRRLQTDYIDLYQSHVPDPDTPVEETLEAYQGLVRAGKVRYIGASAHSPAQLQVALAVAERNGLPRYQAVQNELNLCETTKFDPAYGAFCAREGVGGIHYKGLASGFLTGKYRSAKDLGKSRRGARVAKDYLNPKGLRILAALDGVSARTALSPAAISLAWVLAQTGVAASLVSATATEQLPELFAGAEARLSPDDVARLSAAAAGT